MDGIFWKSCDQDYIKTEISIRHLFKFSVISLNCFVLEVCVFIIIIKVGSESRIRKLSVDKNHLFVSSSQDL